MKKITLGILALFASFTVSAQNTCADAVSVSEGIHTVGTINGTELADPDCVNTPEEWEGGPATAAEWYSFTPSQNMIVNVNTDVAGNSASGDTRVHVFTGTCGALTCVTGNDDAPSGDTYYSMVEFVATAGETYYFVFDDYWSDLGFDFEITTDTDVPDVPGVASNPVPANGATNVPIEFATTGETAVTFAWDEPTTGGAPTSYLVQISSDSDFTPANTIQGNFPTNSLGPVYLPGENWFEVSTTYYWRVTPQNAAGGPDESTVPVWSFTTEDTAGIDTPSTEEFNYFYNSAQASLEINSQTALDNVRVFSILGQEVMSSNLNGNNQASIDVSNLNSGLYLAKVSVNGQTKTIKFVKR